MRIGVYGGTFNPIHTGHIHILREFIRHLSLERVLLVPTGTPPHKDAPELASQEDRFSMCALAVQEIREAPVEISRIEFDRQGKSYSADTLTLLKRRYPEDGLFFLMGEDMFLTVDRWYHPEIICACAALCASPRSESGLGNLKEKQKELEREFGARCFLEDISYLPVSSTQVRELAEKGESLKGLVPERVEDYIREHGLYRGYGGRRSRDDL